MHPGKDGHIRSVRLQVGEKQYSRPIDELCPLELEYDHSVSLYVINNNLISNLI